MGMWDDSPAPSTPRKSTTAKAAPRTSSGKKPLPRGRSFRSDANEAAYRKYKAGGGTAGPKTWYAKHKKKPSILQRVGHAVSAAARTVGRINRDVGDTMVNIFTDTARMNQAVGNQMIALARGKPSEARKFGEKAMRESTFYAPAGRQLAKVKDVRFTKEWHSPARAARELASGPTGLIPGVQTVNQVLNRRGKEMGEHPGMVLMDLLAAKGVMKHAGGNVAAGEVAAEEAARAATVGERLESAGSVHPQLAKLMTPIKQAVGRKAVKIGAKVPRGERAITMEVADSTRDLLKGAKGLDERQIADLDRRIQTGDRPPEGHPLRENYDALAEHQARSAEERLTRSLPREAKQLMKHEVLMKLGNHDVRPLTTRLAAGLQKTLGEDRANAVIADMADAFIKDEVNPHPEFSKPWNRLKREYNVKVENAERRWHLWQEPLTGQIYNYDEFRPLMRKGKHLPEGATLEEVQTLARLGDEPSRAYLTLLEGTQPASFSALIEPVTRQLLEVRNRAMAEQGFGAKAAVKAIDDIKASQDANWLELHQKGVRPVYVPREAKFTPFEEEVPRLRPTSKNVRSPDSFKALGGTPPEYRNSNSYVMILEDEFDVARQQMMYKTISQVYDESGGVPYDLARMRLEEGGMSPKAAHDWLSMRYGSFDLEGGRVVFGKAKPGSLLVPKEVQTVARYYLNPEEFMRGDKILSAWIVPTLFLAPIFQANNILGGAFMTALRLRPNMNLFSDIKEAVAAAREGRILDPRIPSGSGHFPQFRKILSSSDVVSAERLYGQVLGGLTKKLKSPVQSMERMNQFFDSMYRNIVYLNKKSSGFSSAEAAAEAARLMQDWDSLTPLERQVFQRVYPFWTWKRTLIRHALTFPVDHPWRMGVMNWAAREQANNRDESDYVHALMQNMLPIGHPDKKGYQLMVSLRGMDPFADYSSMGTVQGWLGSVHPGLQTLMRVVGYNSYLGGTPATTFPEDQAMDPNTGTTVKRLNWWGLLESFPQGQAVAQWLRGEGAKPGDATLKGVLNWFDKYGAQTRLTPGISNINVKEKEEKYNKRVATYKAVQEGKLRSTLVKGSKDYLAYRKRMLAAGRKPLNDYDWYKKTHPNGKKTSTSSRTASSGGMWG